MKLRFEFTEPMRLKAYYAMQLDRRLNPGLCSQVTFDEWCNAIAGEAFESYLNDIIDNLNNVLERSLENGSESNETTEG